MQLEFGERNRLGCRSARPRAEHSARATNQIVRVPCLEGRPRGRGRLRPRRARSPIIRTGIWYQLPLSLRISKRLVPRLMKFSTTPFLKPAALSASRNSLRVFTGF